MRNNILELKQEFLKDLEFNLIPKINNYFELNRVFCLRDLLTDEQQQDYYYIYLTKGILLLYVYLDYIEIETRTTGKNNFIYRAKRKVNKK